jgi:hypothetical protein
LALLAAGRKRTFLTWLVVAGVGLVLLFETVGVTGLTAYVNQLEHPPLGTDALSLEAAFGVSGSITLVLRLVIIATVLAAACGMRKSPGLAIVVGTLGSLLVTPYLHLSDLTLLAVAGWIVWRERPSVLWRTPLMASWVLVNPLVAMQITPAQNRWPLFELAWLIALAANSWQKSRQSKRDSKLALLRAPEWAVPPGLTSPLRRRVLRHPGDPVMESADHAEASPPAA